MLPHVIKSYICQCIKNSKWYITPFCVLDSLAGLGIIRGEMKWKSKNMWCRYVTWVCALGDTKPVTLFSYIDTSFFIHEKSFNLTGLFHVTTQFVSARLGRVKQHFINTCDDNLRFVIFIIIRVQTAHVSKRVTK